MKSTLSKLKSFLHRKKKTTHRKGLSLETHWSVLLVLFLIINIGIVIFGVYAFYRVEQEDFFKVDVEDSEVLQLNEVKLKSILDRFDAKAAAEAGILAAPPSIVDPSI